MSDKSPNIGFSGQKLFLRIRPPERREDVIFLNNGEFFGDPTESRTPL